MQRHPIEFANAAVKNNIEEWIIHNCSMCGYGCRYLIDLPSLDVRYDTGCHCTNRINIHVSSWGSIATHYNMQSNENVIAKMNEFWVFDQHNIEDFK